MMERSFLMTNWKTTGMAAAILVGGGSIALWASDTRLDDTDSFIGDSVANIASLLDARSPGERTRAELTKSKQARASAGIPAIPADLVSERVLGKVFPADTDDHLIVTPEELRALTPLGIPLTQLPGDEVAPLAPTFVGGPVPIGGGSSFIPGGSTGGGGIGGGGSSGGGGGGQIPIPPEQIPAVPEPSTWIMMLMGAAMCGASMRRQKRLQRMAMA